MRQYKQKQLLELLETLKAVHEEIQQNINNKNNDVANSLLAQCQEAAIDIGNAIEESEGEGTKTVARIEEYCDALFYATNSSNVVDMLDGNVNQIIRSLKNDIDVRKEAVFLPYKAAMWDSLESIYLAAAEDPDCDAYVIPIPYYDKDAYGNFTAMHYEADLFPDYIEITKYDEFDFGLHHPDMIFIHNPYDGGNVVSSVHKFFYAKNLKQYTDCLVYAPYYATSGGMSDDYALMPAYLYADYIVTQSESYRKFYDPLIPQSKILPLGSPKFDAVIKKCQNPPAVPSEWCNKIYDENGNKKKVYFFNTSLHGLMADANAYLNKMEYVFDIFKKHPEACLLWRPHPLLETTFDSVKPEYKERFIRIRDQYINEEWGIYDKTPAIENTIANSDVYVGTSGTSVTSLFGVAGKPIFILNNQMCSLPGDNDWRGSINYQGFLQTLDGEYHDRFTLGPENTLYYSPNNNHHYEFFCRLSDQISSIYQRAYEQGDKIYIFPSDAKHILVVDKKSKSMRKIEMRDLLSQPGAFSGLAVLNGYVYLFPYRYPALVRFNLESEEVTYIDGVQEFNVYEEGNIRIPAAKWVKDDKVYILSKDGNSVMVLSNDDGKSAIVKLGLNRLYYTVGMKSINSAEMWLIPAYGTMVTRWNIESNKTKDFDINIEGLEAWNRDYHNATDRYMFGVPAFLDNELIFAPYWGNKFVKLNPEAGEVTEWKSPFEISFDDCSEYIKNYGAGGFIYDWVDEEHYRFFYSIRREFYEINLRTKEISRIDCEYDRDDIYAQTVGYGPYSEWLRYCCNENVFNTLDDLLNDTISGNQFSKEAQLKAYININASPDGNCGKRVYEAVK